MAAEVGNSGEVTTAPQTTSEDEVYLSEDEGKAVQESLQNTSSPETKQGTEVADPFLVAQNNSQQTSEIGQQKMSDQEVYFRAQVDLLKSLGGSPDEIVALEENFKNPKPKDQFAQASKPIISEEKPKAFEDMSLTEQAKFLKDKKLEQTVLLAKAASEKEAAEKQVRKSQSLTGDSKLDGLFYREETPVEVAKNAEPVKPVPIPGPEKVEATLEPEKAMMASVIDKTPPKPEKAIDQPPTTVAMAPASEGPKQERIEIKKNADDPLDGINS